MADIRDRIDALGASVVNRTDRLASNISHCNSEIDKLQAKLLTSNVIWAIILLAWMVCKW